MTITTYKGYSIKTVGISQYIYRGGNMPTSVLNGTYQDILSVSSSSDGYEQSMAAAKRWINADLKARLQS